MKPPSRRFGTGWYQETGAPVAELVRRAIDAYLAEHESRWGRRAPR